MPQTKYLSTGEFAKIMNTTKETLFHYEEMGIFYPDHVGKNGYRYYSIEQLETMLFINRLKSYNFSLEEIKTIRNTEGLRDEALCLALMKKEREIEKQVREYQKTLEQLNQDISNLKQGNSIMSYMENINIRLTEVPEMYLLSIRKMVHEYEFPEEYGKCYGQLFKKIKDKRLTPTAPPMVGEGIRHGNQRFLPRSVYKDRPARLLHRTALCICQAEGMGRKRGV